MTESLKELMQLPIVLNLRGEDGFWNAYIAFPNHPHIEKIKLGSIAMGAVTTNEKRKEAFKNLMIAAMGDLVEEIIGVRPAKTVERPAPHA